MRLVLVTLWIIGESDHEIPSPQGPGLSSDAGTRSPIASMFPANFVMWGIPILAGEPRLEITFHSTSFRRGVFLSLVSLLGTCLSWGFAVLRRQQGVTDSAMSTIPESAPPKNKMLHRFTTIFLGFGYYSGATAAAFLIGGSAYLVFWDATPPRNEPRQHIVASCLASGLAVTLAAIAGWRFVRRAGWKRLAFGTIALALLLPLTLLLAELVTRLFVPTWPAIGLHGVAAEVASKAWLPVGEQARSVGVNDWGQRDRPRLHKPVGTRRIGFLGDSFLEEGSTVPVSLRVEQKLARRDLEVINLGVSASSPDEYFHRLRSVALPLGIQRCMMFVFAGNDFVEAEESLRSAWGIAAVYPRGSFLSSVGLLGTNHLLMNRFRPLMTAWFAAGELRQQEEYRRQVLQAADEESIRHLLVNSAQLDPPARARLWNRLAEPAIVPFLQMLKSPDAGQFRSYYLAQGLWSAANGQTQWPRNDEGAAMEWIRRSAALCQSRHVEFTLVIIPEAFQVDSRLVEQWRPLTDMRHLTRPCREAAKRLRDRARAEGIEVLDLHDCLQDVPGTYLNLDGHWSDKGVELVSDLLADWLMQSETSTSAAATQ